MVRRFLLVSGLLGLAVAPAAGAAGIRVEVDRAEASLEEQILLQVVVEGVQGAVRPTLPVLADFEVHPQGTMQNTQIVNGRVSQSLIFRYLLVPTREGVFEIGQARVELDGTVHESRPFRIKISKAPQDRSVFITASVSEKEPWVGQQVIYTVRFLRRVLVDNARLEPLEVPGVLMERLETSTQEYQTTVDGQAYAVQEVRLALFPQRPGTIEIPAASISCEILVRGQRRGSLLGDMFGGATERRPRTLRSEPIRLQVKALPSPPAGYSGLVGQFSVESKASRTTLAVGESTTLEVAVSGRGNAMAISEPSLGDLSAFKVYDEQPTSSLIRTGRELAGRKTYRKALVPTQAGVVTIPPAELIVFDPEAGRYRTSESAAIPLQVSAREGAEDVAATVAAGPSAGKVEVRILGDDILPPSRDLLALAPAASPAWWWLALLVPPLGWLLLAWRVAHHRRLAGDVSLRRRREGPRRLRQALDEIAGGDPRGSAQATSRALREYLGDMLGFEGTAATPAEIGGHLERGGVGGELTAETRAFLERLDAASYGGAPVGDAAVRAAELAKRVGATLRRGGRA